MFVCLPLGYITFSTGDCFQPITGFTIVPCMICSLSLTCTVVSFECISLKHQRFVGVYFTPTLTFPWGLSPTNINVFLGSMSHIPHRFLGVYLTHTPPFAWGLSLTCTQQVPGVCLLHKLTFHLCLSLTYINVSLGSLSHISHLFLAVYLSHTPTCYLPHTYTVCTYFFGVCLTHTQTFLLDLSPNHYTYDFLESICHNPMFPWSVMFFASLCMGQISPHQHKG